MNDATAMRSIEGIRDLHPMAQQVGRGERTALEPTGQGPSTISITR